MAVTPIPEGYHTLTPYLIADDLDTLIDFLKTAFGATENERLPGKDGKTGHADVSVGDSHVMLGAAQESWPALPCMTYVYVPDTDATFARALAAGATSVQEPGDMFYGDRNAGVKDPLGNYWWIATRLEDLSRAELEKRAMQHMR